MTEDSELLNRKDFQVMTDGGIDRYGTLLNAVPVAPFYILGFRATKAVSCRKANFCRAYGQGSLTPALRSQRPATMQGFTAARAKQWR